MTLRQQSDITTYHEAGHAVMAMAHGFVVREMTNVSNDEAMGQVKIGIPNPLTTTSRAGVVLFLAAGMAADYLHWKGAGVEDENCEGGRSDRELAEVHLAELEDAGQFDTYLAIAIHFLKRPDVWEKVEFFAKLMAESGTVNDIQNESEKVPKFGPPEWELLRLALDDSKHNFLAAP